MSTSSPAPDSTTRLGHYEVERELGAGAMGVVLLARDARLERRVALKSLPDAFAGDEERLARFEREARMLAALHHPHVASLFGLEDLDGRRFLVMEYVEGETLAQRIARGVVDVGEALKLAEQIARGLAAAHDKGIIHRDLKPGNVMVTPAGGAKVVDFGLAKDVTRSAVAESGLVSGSGPDVTVVDSRISGQDVDDITRLRSADASDEIEIAPTVVARSGDAASAAGEARHPASGSSSDPLATEPGEVLGTAAYMSPEQARGQAVDRRCDVWAFGCVLFEMLSGRRPFQGADLMQTMTAVLFTEPPWDVLPVDTPPTVERLLRRCLRKDPDERLRDLGDAAIELHDVRTGNLPLASAAARRRPPWSRLGGAAMVGLVAGLLVALLAALFTGAGLRTEHTATAPVRFELATPDFDWGGVVVSNLAVSPDGRSWVYRSTATDPPQLVLRHLGDIEPVPIPGTEGGVNPFFSPDGRHLGFSRGPDLLRLEPFTGSPRVLASLEVGGFTGQASWGEDGSIVYSALPPAVFRVDQEGGAAEQILGPGDLPGVTLFAWPQHAGPDGSFLIYTAVEDRLETQISSADGTSLRPVGGVSSRAVFLDPDLLLFARERQVLAQRLDLASATLLGEPTLLSDRVAWDQRVGNAGFAAAPELFVAAQRERRARMQWFDTATGAPGAALGEPADLSSARISPDGERVAVAVADVSGGAEDLWVYELARDVGQRLTTTGASEGLLAWSPDSTRLTYFSDAFGPPDVVVREAVPGATESALVDWGDPVFPGEWLPDGSAIVFYNFPQHDIYLAPVDGSPPTLWLRADGLQNRIRASPDGTWLAFRSTELGTSEIFAAPLADSGRRIRVTTDGGVGMVWAPDGRSLYVHDDRSVAEIGIDTATARVSGAPRLVLTIDPPESIYEIDLAPTGDRLLVTLLDESLLSARTQVQVGWRDRLPGDD